MARRPTKLEVHRLKYRAAAGKLPLMLWKDLSDIERHQFSTSFFQSIFLDKQRRDPYEVYVEELASWGIMCPHPQHKRLYGGTLRSESPCEEYLWYRCECCNSRIPNRVSPSLFIDRARG